RLNRRRSHCPWRRLRENAVLGKFRIPRLQRLPRWRVAGVTSISFGRRFRRTGRLGFLPLLLPLNRSDSQQEHEQNERNADAHAIAEVRSKGAMPAIRKVSAISYHPERGCRLCRRPHLSSIRLSWILHPM